MDLAVWVWLDTVTEAELPNYLLFEWRRGPSLYQITTGARPLHSLILNLATKSIHL